jgi:hypothetical protein
MSLRRQKNVGQMVEEIREEFHIWERAKRGRRLDLARELALGGGGWRA